MQVEARLPIEPVPHAGMFVRGVVVQDQVNVQVCGHGGVDGLEEHQELVVTVLEKALIDHPAGRDLQRCELRRGAVPLAVMSHSPGTTRSDRQRRLRVIQRLDL